MSIDAFRALHDDFGWKRVSVAELGKDSFFCADLVSGPVVVIVLRVRVRVIDVRVRVIRLAAPHLQAPTKVVRISTHRQGHTWKPLLLRAHQSLQAGKTEPMLSYLGSGSLTS